jgi:penicillin-insensitive murein endopeptidase
LHSLQRGPGAHREGVRLRGRPGLLAIAVLGAVLGIFGCAGPLALDADGLSASIGVTGDGTVRAPVELPLEGDGYAVPARWRARHSNYGTEELVGVVVRAARAVDRARPGGTAAIGDLSRRSGGGSVEHKSHQSGRDVDVFFYSVDRAGAAVPPGEAMIRYGVEGQAVRWSPAHGFAAPNAPVPAVRFDAARNWAFVRALLMDEDAEVEWIFIQHDLAALLLRTATVAGEDPALVARAAFILHEPTDSEPHDDHMHVRLYCDAGDRRLGCVDRGPVRWLKKGWKYMAAPFGRDDGLDARVARELGAARAGELPVAVGAAVGVLRS